MPKVPAREKVTVSFIPYGLMHTDYANKLRLLQRPLDWRPDPIKGKTREELWQLFFGDLLAELTGILWPRFDAVNNLWVGDSVSQMAELTEADFRVMSQLRKDAVFDRVPDPPLRGLDCPTHRQFFLMEDAGKGFGENLKFYNSGLSDTDASAAKEWFIRGLDGKDGSMGVQFKAHLQRPRPYQTALMMGQPEFSHENAVTAATPSMCSNHCLQGLLSTGAIIEQALLTGQKLDEPELRGIRRYAVDIGDRRVMAGVHYPSDNLASWIITLKHADQVYRHRGVRQNLAAAIVSESLVFKTIEADEGAKNGGPFSRAVKLIRQLAGSKISAATTAVTRPMGPRWGVSQIH